MKKSLILTILIVGLVVYYFSQRENNNDNLEEQVEKKINDVEAELDSIKRRSQKNTNKKITKEDETPITKNQKTSNVNRVYPNGVYVDSRTGEIIGSNHPKYGLYQANEFIHSKPSGKVKIDLTPLDNLFKLALKPSVVKPKLDTSIQRVYKLKDSLKPLDTIR